MSAVGPFRIVLAFLLFGWFVKASFFVPYLYKSAFHVPISHDFFPGFFQWNGISAIAYPAVLLSLACFLTQRPLIFQGAAGLWVLCAGILCLHQNTYNDATFVISFWGALWLLWFSISAPRDAQAMRHAPILASCIVGLMFLGGFVGKLTPRYANGEIIGRIFLEQGGESPLVFLFYAFDASYKPAILSIMAKFIILGEGLLALNLIVYRRFFWALSLCIIPALVLFSSWRILSVISGLIGLLVAAYYLKSHDRQS